MSTVLIKLSTPPRQAKRLPSAALAPSSPSRPRRFSAHQSGRVPIVPLATRHALRHDLRNGEYVAASMRVARRLGDLVHLKKPSGQPFGVDEACMVKM